MLCQFIPFITIYFATTLNQVIVLFIVLGLTKAITCTVWFVYTLEFIQPHMQVYCTMAYSFCDPLIFAIMTFYFQFFSKHWVHISMMAIVCAVIGGVNSLYISESPKYLLKQKRYEEAREILQTIHRVNKVDQPFNVSLYDEKLEL